MVGKVTSFSEGTVRRHVSVSAYFPRISDIINQFCNGISAYKYLIMAITEFDLWLDSVDLSDFNDDYALYHSVSGIEDWGSFRAERGRGSRQILVHSYDCDEPLLLASDKARDAFLKK